MYFNIFNYELHYLIVNKNYSITNFFGRLSLGNKISLLSSIVILAIAMFISFYFPAKLEEQAIKAEIEKTSSLAQVASYLVQSSLFFYEETQDSRSVTEELNKLEQFKDIVYVVIVSPNGSIISSINLNIAQKYRYLENDNGIDKVYLIAKSSSPVIYNNEVIGKVYLATSYALLKDEIWQIHTAILLISFFLLIIGVAAISIIANITTRPLRGIAHTIKRISEGDLSVRAEIVYRDEVGELSASFNEMVSSLQKSHSEFEQLNKNLETRVDERTQALQFEIIEHHRTEDALRRSQHQLLREQNIFRGGPTVVFRLRTEKNKLYINYVSSNVNQFGYNSAELIESDTEFANIIHPIDRTVFADEVKGLNNSDASYFESYFRIKKTNTEIRYIFSFFVIIRDNSSLIQYLDGYLIDITSAKQSEIALVESESRFKTVFFSAGIGMALTDTIGNITGTNSAFQSFIGYSEEELNQFNIVDISHSEDFQEEKKFFNSSKTMIETVTKYESEKRYIRKDGNIVWGKLTATFIRGSDGVPLFALGMVEDITPRKAAEQVLGHQSKTVAAVAESLSILLTRQELEQSFIALLEKLGRGAEIDRVYIFQNHFDTVTRELMFSQKYEWANETVTKEIDNPVLQNICYSRWFTMIYENLSTRQQFKRLVKEFPDEERLILEEQNVLSLLLVPIFSGNDFWGFIGFDDCHIERQWTEYEESILKMVGTSIGGMLERYKEQQELLAAKEIAVESDRLKSTLLSNMSHEFRTPLNGILGYSEVLASELKGNEIAYIPERIITSANRLMTTLDAILDLSQLEANKIITRNVRCDITAEIYKIAEKYRPRAEANNLQLQYIHSSGAVESVTDIRLFSKVISHLVENAIKFTTKGAVTISILPCEKNGASFAEIKVADNGIGIAPEHQAIIFQDFKQLSEGFGRGFEGSGLGLSVARRIAQLINTDISIESEQGIGSTFTVVVPIIKIIPENIKQPAAVSSNKDFALNFFPKILIVEDNLINKEVTMLFLKGTGELFHAPTGERALDMAKKNRFDIILMDIHLGNGIDGVETTKQLRLMEEYKNIPIVAVTGFTIDGEQERFLAQGLSRYIPKPFDKATIRGLIASLCREIQFQRNG